MEGKLGGVRGRAICSAPSKTYICDVREVMERDISLMNII